MKVSKNIKWLKENRENYNTEWVALSDGVLLGVSDNLLELTEKFGLDNVLYTKVNWV